MAGDDLLEQWRDAALVEHTMLGGLIGDRHFLNVQEPKLTTPGAATGKAEYPPGQAGLCNCSGLCDGYVFTDA